MSEKSCRFLHYATVECHLTESAVNFKEIKTCYHESIIVDVSSFIGRYSSTLR